MANFIIGQSGAVLNWRHMTKVKSKGCETPEKTPHICRSVVLHTKKLILEISSGADNALQLCSIYLPVHSVQIINSKLRHTRCSLNHISGFNGPTKLEEKTC